MRREQQLDDWKVDADGIAWLTCDMPGSAANVLSGAVLQELAASSTEVAELAARRRGRAVRQAERLHRRRRHQGIRPDSHARQRAIAWCARDKPCLQQLEDLALPDALRRCTGSRWAAAWNWRWPARYRVGADDAKLVSGLAGSACSAFIPDSAARCARCGSIGVRPAMDLMLKGKPFKGRRALERRIDRSSWCRPRSSSQRAKALLLQAPRRRRPRRSWRGSLNLAPLRPFVATPGRPPPCSIGVRREHYPAPYAIVDLWQRYGAVGAASYEAEARSISELMCTPTSRNLVRVFMLQDRLKGLGGKQQVEFKHVHVIGAGVMGGDIATLGGTARHDCDAAGSQRGAAAAGARRARRPFRQTAGAIPQAAAAATRVCVMDVDGDGVAACRRRSSRPSSKTSRRSKLSMRNSSRSSNRAHCSRRIPPASRSKR